MDNKLNKEAEKTKSVFTVLECEENLKDEKDHSENDWCQTD